MSVAVAYKDKVVKQLTGGVGQLLKANGVTIFEGAAEVQSPTQITRAHERRLDAGAAHEQADPGQRLGADPPTVRRTRWAQRASSATTR